MQSSKSEIVLLSSSSQSSVFLYNYLKQHFTIRAAIIEKPVSRSFLIKRRAKKLGWLKVLGQLAFQVTIPKLLKSTSGRQYNQLLSQYGMSAEPIDKDVVINVNSVNDASTIQLLQQLQPKLIVINGTRIISKKVLTAVDCPFINTHAGITPKYRGVHGGYWALANKDKENVGVTIHFVDKGIDTGEILVQKRITVSKKDNFITYPVHQLGTALPELVKIIPFVLNNTVSTSKALGISKLWHHPTIWQYIYYLIKKGIK